MYNNNIYNWARPFEMEVLLNPTKGTRVQTVHQTFETTYLKPSIHFCALQV